MGQFLDTFNTTPPNTDSDDDLIVAICKKVKKGTGKSFKDLKEINGDQQNLLMYYFISFKSSGNNMPLTNEELKFVIKNSNLNQLSEYQNSALTLAISNNNHIIPHLNSEIYDLLLKSSDLSQLNTRGYTSFDFVLGYYSDQNSQAYKPPLTIKQLHVLYEAHLKVKQLTQEQTDLFAKILADVHKNSEIEIKNRALIDSYLTGDFSKLENKDKEIKELKQMVLSLNEQVLILTNKVATLEDKSATQSSLYLEDKPSLQTSQKLKTATNKLADSSKTKALEALTAVNAIPQSSDTLTIKINQRKLL